jgi:Nucleotidyl transferase AbiEii toxin, Type IV TA system
MLEPNLSCLAASQRALWKELEATPRDFVLYGGTALAIRLGHRQSVDFDFFSNEPFEPAELMNRISYLDGAITQQSQHNTLTAIISRPKEVHVSFFGGLAHKRVQNPDLASDNHIQVASLLDLAASKVLTVQQRALAKDYVDIAALLDAGIGLPRALAAARAIYGAQFNSALSLKALTYFDDGDLHNLDRDMQTKLRTAAVSVNLGNPPLITALPGLAIERENSELGKA